MPELTHAVLLRKAKILCTNGLKADAQAIISQVGYAPARLAETTELLTQIDLDDADMQVGLRTQKQATRTEADARALVEQAMSSFDETCRVIFANDEPTLSALLLTPQHATVTGPDGQSAGMEAVRPPESTAEVLKRWHTQLAVASSLGNDQVAVLAMAGWPAVRLGKTLEAVTAYSDADLAQQAAIQTYQTAQTRYADNIAALRAWYSTAAALCKRAIKDADLENKHNLLELLDLD